MASKPLTLFVLIATTGKQFFKVGAERHQADGLQDLSGRSRLQTPAAQLLGKAAVVGMAPIASVFRSQLTGQSEASGRSLTTVELAQEACMAMGLTLLSAWCVKQFLTYWREVVLPAGQPTKGACLSGSSSHNELNTSSFWGLWALLTCPWRFCKRKLQRRRLYAHAAVMYLEGILPRLCGSSSRLPRPSQRGSHGLHDWHEAQAKGFLMPLEVAACRTQPELSQALQRLLADRWWELDDPQPMLETVFEDESLMLDEPFPEEVLSDLPNEQVCELSF